MAVKHFFRQSQRAVETVCDEFGLPQRVEEKMLGLICFHRFALMNVYGRLRKDLLLADDVETVLDGCVDGFKLFQLKNSRIVSMMCSVEARVEGLCKVRRSCLPTD